MKDLDYNKIFAFSYELVKDLNPVKAEKDVHYLDKPTEQVFLKYFEQEVMSKKVNSQGHNKSVFDGKTLSEIKEEFEYQRLTNRCCEQIKFAISYKLLGGIMNNLDALKKGTDLTVQSSIIQEFLNILTSSVINVENYCFVCGTNVKLSLKNDEYTNILSPDSRLAQYASYHPCKYPNGLEEYSNVLSVPSGRLMFANDLRCLFPEKDSLSDAYIIDKSGYYNDINSEVGMMYNQEFWNKLGMIYVQVGNTSPDIIQNKETGYVFAAINHTCKKNEDVCGHISTELWAICGIDYNLMKDLCEQHNIDFEKLSKECIEVLVEPGEYTIRSFNAARNACKNNFFEVVKVE